MQRDLICQMCFRSKSHNSTRYTRHAPVSGLFHVVCATHVFWVKCFNNRLKKRQPLPAAYSMYATDCCALSKSAVHKTSSELPSSSCVHGNSNHTSCQNAVRRASCRQVPHKRCSFVNFQSKSNQHALSSIKRHFALVTILCTSIYPALLAYTCITCIEPMKCRRATPSLFCRQDSLLVRFTSVRRIVFLQTRVVP